MKLEQINERIQKLSTIHGDEIGMRAKEALMLLKQLRESKLALLASEKTAEDLSAKLKFAFRALDKSLTKAQYEQFGKLIDEGWAK